MFNDRITEEKMREERLNDEMAQITGRASELKTRISQLETQISRERENISSMETDSRNTRPNPPTDMFGSNAEARDAMNGREEGSVGNNRMLPMLLSAGHIENLLNNLTQSLQWAINVRGGSPKGLTKEQIKKIPIIIWKDSMKTRNQTYESCPICYVDYENNQQIKKLNCNHAYHENCLSIWLEKKKECPVCKVEIKP